MVVGLKGSSEQILSLIHDLQELGIQMTHQRSPRAASTRGCASLGPGPMRTRRDGLSCPGRFIPVRPRGQGD